MPDSATYWATVVQVVPVLFIAVMIEFRWLFAQASKTPSKFYASRGVRVFAGTYLFVVAMGLCFVLVFSLSSLRNGDPADGANGYLSLLVLSAAAGLGIGGPGVVLAFQASQDVWKAMHREMPWSAFWRSNRNIARAEEVQQRQDRQIRDLMLMMRRSLASQYVSASRIELTAKSFPEPKRAETVAKAKALYERADQLRAEIDTLSRTRPPELTPFELSDILEAERERHRLRLAELANRVA